MGRGDKKLLYLSEISSARQLSEARRELAIREWFARDRLMDDAAEVLNLGTLVSLVSPRGSILGRVAGGMFRGFSAARTAAFAKGAAVAGARAAAVAKNAAVSKKRAEPRKVAEVTLKSTPSRAKSPSAAVKPATAKPATAKPASAKLAGAKLASVKPASAKPAAKPAVQKRAPEILVEVELDQPKQA